MHSFINGILSYPHLDQPYKSPLAGADGKAQFSCVILINPKDPTAAKQVADMQKRALDLAERKFPGKGAEFIRLAKERGFYFLKDGNRPKDDGTPRGPEYTNRYYINAKEDQRPGLFKADTSPCTWEDGILYAGCKCVFVLDLSCWGTMARGGVSTYLKAVQFAGDGEAFGSAPVRSSDLTPIQTEPGVGGGFETAYTPENPFV